MTKDDCQNQNYLTKHVIFSPFTKIEKFINTREPNKAFIIFLNTNPLCHAHKIKNVFLKTKTSYLNLSLCFKTFIYCIFILEMKIKVLLQGGRNEM